MTWQSAYARRHHRVRLRDPRQPRPAPPSVAQTRAAAPWYVQVALGYASTPPWRPR